MLAGTLSKLDLDLTSWELSVVSEEHTIEEDVPMDEVPIRHDKGQLAE